MADFVGTGGPDNFTGTGDADNFDMSQGGRDTVSGGGGDDMFDFGGALSGKDSIDGGDGADYLRLDGDYSGGLTITSHMIRNVENILLFGGSDYHLTLGDKLVGAGTTLLVQDAGAGTLNLDASAMVQESLDLAMQTSVANTIRGSQANDLLIEFGTSFRVDGQGGDDTLGADRGLDSSSHFDGGDGFDKIQFAGDLTITGSMVHNVEEIDLTGQSTILLADGVVAAGGFLRVVTTITSASVDGSAEKDGAYQMVASNPDAGLPVNFIGGHQGDQISGGFGDDTLTGSQGADTLFGSLGSDTFVYVRAADSTKKAADTIGDFDASADHIDLSAIDARTDAGGDQAFHLVNHFTGHAGQLALVFDSSQGVTHVEGDIDGDGRADLWIDVAGQLTDTTGFVL